MRMFFFVVTLEIIILVGGTMLATPFDSRELTILLILMGVILVANVVMFWNQIRLWLNPAARVYQRGLTERQRKEQDNIESMIKYMQELGFTGRVTYDPARRVASAPIRLPRSRWRKWVLNQFIWLANRRLLPERALFWIGERLGYKRGRTT